MDGETTLGPVLIDRETIDATVARMAAELEADLEDGSAVFIGVLKGCVYFFTELTRSIRRPLQVDFIQTSSYGASTTSSGSVVLVKDITTDVRGRDVYLVEDIVDTGTTLKDVVEMIRARHPRSIHIVALLSKPSRRQVEVEVDYLGMEIEDRFVVGYGLDFAEHYRNLPDIHELRQEPNG